MSRVYNENAFLCKNVLCWQSGFWQRPFASIHGIVEVVDGAMLGTVMEVASDPRLEKRDAAGVEPLEKTLGAEFGIGLDVLETRGSYAAG